MHNCVVGVVDKDLHFIRVQVNNVNKEERIKMIKDGQMLEIVIFLGIKRIVNVSGVEEVDFGREIVQMHYVN